jgi:hypothetical protein
MLTLTPYLLNETVWVFDDERTGLKEEAFVLGMSEMISRLISQKQIPHASRGFSLNFSGEPFDGFDAVLKWKRSDGFEILPDEHGNRSPIAGNWYQGCVDGLEMEGWLCPALGLYFRTAPETIYVRADPLKPGINPIWIPKEGQLVRRFVSASP